MSITGINYNSSLSDLYQLHTSQSSSTASSSDSLTTMLGDEDSSNNSADSIILSAKGKIYSRLQELQESNPEKFKKICSQIASKLTDKCGSSASDLISAFTEAGESGSLSALQSSTTQSSSSVLSKYLNGDGYGVLANLQKTDPEKFKTLCAQAASQLTLAATNHGDKDASELAKLFSKAAESGNISDLKITSSTQTSTLTGTYAQNVSYYLNQYQQNSVSSDSSSTFSMIQQALSEAGITI